MNISHIETFLLIVKSHSIVQAAKTLFLSQSAVSNRLQQLESELGYQLLNRAKGCREVSLTPEGEEFFRIAEKWSALYYDSQQIRQGTYSAPLRIGGLESICNYSLAPFWKQYLLANPQSRLYIRISHSMQAFQDLQNHEIDLALVGYYMNYPEIVLEPIDSETYKILIHSKEQPEATIDPAQLSPKLEIYKSWGVEFERWHDFWWKNSAWERGITLTDVSLLRNVMFQEGNWMVLPSKVADAFSELPDMWVSDLVHTPPDRICYKATHLHPSQKAKEEIELFSDALLTYLKSQK